ATSAATWAANGVLLREPLKPWPPLEAQDSAPPWRSVIVMIVLLNEAWTCAMPSATFLRTFLRTRCAAVFGALAMLTFSQSCAGCDRINRSLLDHRARLARTLAGAGIRAGALAANRQAAAMTEASVAAQVHQALDVDRHLAAQIAFDRDATDFLADLFQIGVGQVLDLSVKGHPGRFADLLRGRTADAVDRGQADLGVLVGRNVDTSNACHVRFLKLCRGLLKSALALLVTRIGTDHAHHALATDDLAIPAHLL